MAGALDEPLDSVKPEVAELVDPFGYQRVIGSHNFLIDFSARIKYFYASSG